MYNVFNLKFCIYTDAASIILRSKLWALVTSLETTYACIGCWFCISKTSANWLIPLAPTELNDGGVEAAGWVGTEGTEPPPLEGIDIPSIDGSFVEIIFLTLVIPETTAAAAAAKPNAGPITGIPAKDLYESVADW